MVGLPGAGGLPADQALHPRWEQHHRPVAAEFFTADIVIRRHDDSGSVFDPGTGRTTYPEPADVFTGQARVQRMSQQEVTRMVGDRQVVIRGVTVSLPVTAPQVQIGDELQVLAYRDPDSGDPHLIGRPLWLHDIRPGSLLFQRDLVALDSPPTSR